MAVLIAHRVDLLAPAAQVVVVQVRMEQRQRVLLELRRSAAAAVVEPVQVVRAATAALAS